MKPVRVRPHRRSVETGLRNPIRSPFVRRDPTPPNEDVREAARTYMRSIGRELLPAHPRVKTDPETMRRIARGYDALRDDASDDPAVIGAYMRFAIETAAQWEFLKDLYKIEFVDFDPYQSPTGGPSSALMFEDIRDNNHLFVYRGGPPHPIMSKIIHPPTGETMNNIFRAVHDLNGHAIGAWSFSADGELNAYLSHKELYGSLAGKALATETLSQNAWYNFSSFNEGKPASERAFPPQKADLLPEELIL